MSYLLDNIAQTLVFLGILALIIEVAVLGFATFVLFFVGLSLIFSGGLMYAGFIDASWLSALWVTALSTFVLAISLWKPLKRMQSHVDSGEVNNDFAEIEFILEQDLPSDDPLFHAYSGIQWQVKATTAITKGTTVKVVKKEVGVLWVEAVQ